MSNEIETILSIIPQSYYDFIAKIIPGFVALEISSYIYYETLLVPNNIWEVIFGFVGIYIIGIILDIGGLLLSQAIEMITICGCKNNICPNGKQLFITVREIHSDLHEISETQDANIIIKMLAETVLLRSLSLLFTLLSIFNITPLASFYGFDTNQLFLLPSILMAVVLSILRLELQRETAIRADLMLPFTSDKNRKRFFNQDKS